MVALRVISSIKFLKRKLGPFHKTFFAVITAILSYLKGFTQRSGNLRSKNWPKFKILNLRLPSVC